MIQDGYKLYSIYQKWIIEYQKRKSNFRANNDKEGAYECQIRIDTIQLCMHELVKEFKLTFATY